MTHHITRTSQSHTKKKTLAPTCLCAAGDPRPTGLLVLAKFVSALYVVYQENTTCLVKSQCYSFWYNLSS